VHPHMMYKGKGKLYNAHVLAHSLLLLLLLL
jgi:hypothetical protein